MYVDLADTLTAKLVGPTHDIWHQATEKRGNENDELSACVEQDTLTDEMVGLAAQMRRNAAEMESAVKERGRLLNSAETTLDGNLDATQRAVRDSRVIRTRRATNALPYGVHFTDSDKQMLPASRVATYPSMCCARPKPRRK